MMMSTGVCRWLFLLISLSTWTTITGSKEMRVVCYYTNWSVYRPGAAKFNPQNINPYLCTHLIYAFGGFTKENTLKPFDKYQDIEKGGYAKFTGLKTYNKNLKTMLAIGGWNEGSSRFSPMVANAERRKELVKNAIKFLRQNHFDGLDLDWEYPSFRDGGKARDRDNYAQLVQELREEFDRESEKTGRPRLLLTMAVPAGIEYVNKGYDIPKLTKYLDWMNILSYDYHSAFEPAVNHHAPLYSLEEDNEYNYDADLNIDFTIKHYLKLGADPNKLILGIPTYGRSYTLYNPEAFELGSPADGPGDMGEATRENGYLAYYEICENVKNQDWEVEQPNPDAMGPYAFKDNQWVGYDDEDIVRKKSEYVAENGLGGIMFWAIDNDDFRGNCHGKPYPLIEAAKEALLNAYGITDDNLISPPSKPVKPRTRTRTKASNKVKSDDEEETKVEKVSTSSGSRRRNRNKSKAKDEERDNFASRQKARRKESRKTTATSTYSSLKVVTPSYTTPAPPSTPDLDGAFKCEDEGFFPHPKDCKKYFWCLSGAGDSGIVAHQFTCPAGLYFNKAADSCDYTQNVLCNKKLQKPTTTTQSITKESTSTTTTPAPLLYSTPRPLPKITAATSKTTIKQTTTTESYDDDDYEYDDEDEDDNESEEDPRVIKELFDLIRKAGGIEELEKQLKHTKSDAGSGTDATTQAAISKSLYERVLSKAAKSSLSSKRLSSNIYNSRGPQNDGLSGADEKSSRGKSERGKLQYTSISRNRPSTSKSVGDEERDEEERDEKESDDAKDEDVKLRRNFSKKSQPEYVTIRRPRVSTTTETSESESGFSRNKALGEGSEEGDDEDGEVDDDDSDGTSKKTFVPQYVNIRRQRPSTTEETTTSKYAAIRRGSSTEPTSEGNDESDDTTSKYKTIRRGSTSSPSTTTPAEENSTSRVQSRRGTTIPTSTTASDVSDNSKYKNFRRGSTTQKSSTEKEDASSKYKTLRRGTTTPAPISLDTEIPDISSNKIVRGITTPLDDENDVTSRYQTLIRGSTTAHYESDTASTSLNGTSSGSSVADVGTPTPAPSQDVDKVGTSINLIEETATLQPLSTTENTLNSTTDDSPATTKPQPDESTTIQDHASSVSTTEVTSADAETTTPQKKRPQILDPRPFSIGSRSSSTSVKPVTESTTQTTKVSQSNFKLRLRPKTSGLHKDVDKKINVSSTESPITKSTLRFRSRGSSRFGSSSRNANKNLSEKEETNDDDTSNNIEAKNLFSTTERRVEDNRAYRPSELADLSSLTAVDFSKIKELNFGASSPRRRVRPAVSSTTTTSAESPEETINTTSRPLPLARKLADSSFGKSRRTIASKATNDQTDSGSDINPSTKRVRGFASRTTRQPSSTESTENVINKNESSSDVVNITPRTRRIIRRFRTSTAKPGSNNIESAVNKTASGRPTFKKPSFTTLNKNQSSPLTNELSTTNRSKVDKQSPLQRLFNKKPARLPFALQQNKVEEEENDDSFEDSSTEEGENIKLSESNIRENSDVNSFDTSGKQRRKLVKFVRQKSESLHEKTNYEEKNSEKLKDTETSKEDVTLRETENSDDIVSEVKESNSTEIDQSNENVNKNETHIDEGAEEFSNSTNVESLTNYTETVKLESEEVKTSTEPNIIIRTRKIIRKIKPTVASVKVSTEQPNGRKRKIIRRLRPSTVPNKASGESETNKTTVDEKPSNKPAVRQLYGRGRSTNSPGATTTESAKETDEGDTSKRLFRPSVSKPRSKYTKPNSGTSRASDVPRIKSPARIALRLYGKPSTTTPKNAEDDAIAAENITNAEEVTTKRVSTSEQANDNQTKSENETRRLSFKPLVRSTTTAKADDVTTEPLKDEYISRPLFRPKLRNKLNDDNDTGSTTKIVDVENATETSTNLKEQISKSNEKQADEEIAEIASESTQLKSTARYLYKSIDRSATTEKTDNINNTEYDTGSLNKDIKYETTSNVAIESTTTAAENNEDIESSTKFLDIPSTETPIHSDETEASNAKSEIHQSRTSSYNPYTPITTTDGGSFEDEEEDDEEDDTGDRKRNYVSVFRSSTSTNSFDNFDSEFEEETPKFDDSLLDDNIQDDDDDFNHDEEYKHDNDDKHNDDHLSEIDKLIGDTSEEFKTEPFDSSSAPNDLIKDEDTASPTEKILESSSIKNKFYRPDRPSFIRPRVTVTSATVEKPISIRPKYKTFSRTKSLTKETIQIHAFNNTGVDGKPETGVNKLLLTNRYKYKTIERTTSAPTDNSTDENNNEKLSEEYTTSEGTTDSVELTTILQMLNVEEFSKTTENSELTTKDNEISDSIETTQNINEESTISINSLEPSTRPNNPDIENEIFGSTTSAADDSISTESRDVLTFTDSTITSEDNVNNATTEVIFITSLRSEQNDSTNNTEFLAVTISDAGTTPSSDNLTPSADTSEVPETTTDTETSTFIIPETTTPYRRRSTLRSIEARPKFTPVRRKNTYLTRSTTESSFGKFGRNRFKSTTEKITTDSPIGVATPRRSRFRSTTPITINKSLYKYSTTEKPTYIRNNAEEESDDINDEEATTESIANDETTTVKQVLTSALPINKFIYAYSTASSKSEEDNLEEKVDGDNEDVEEEEGEFTESEDEEVNEDINEPEKATGNSPVIPANKSRVPRPRVINRPAITKNTRRPNSPIRNNSPQFSGRSTTARIVNKPKTFGKTTETPKVNEDLSDIDTEAVKNRNKNLFSKKRKMNTPVTADEETTSRNSTTTSSEETVSEASPEVSQEHITVAPAVTEPVTKPSIPETTELLTTLHHIFAEVKDNATGDTTEGTTESLNAVTTTTGKIERLIEVSRIVQVNTKEAKGKNHVVEEQKTGEDVPVVNKIGEVSRVTVIQVVDGNDTSNKIQDVLDKKIKEIHFESPVYIPEGATTENSADSVAPLDISGPIVEHPAKVEEIPAANIQGKINVTNITVTINSIPELLETHSYRENRKFDVFGINSNQLGPDGKAEIIDGTSHINIITPRPVFSTEASTIALEGLFQTDSPQTQFSTKFLNSNDELLEAEHSKFVNVRVLHQDESTRLDKGVKDNTKFIPIKLLKQEEEEVTMKAQVVEVAPKTNIDSIKIVPIRVEMSKKLAENVPIFRVGAQIINRENT